MFVKYMTTGLAASALLASVASAQTPTATTDPANKMAPAAASDSSFQGDWRASKLVGLKVYNDANESVGSINDLLADKNGAIKAVVIGVGGFLGVGEHYVAVSPSSVNVRYDSKNEKWLASMNTTKDALKAAPEFKYPK